jgi:hypothetical protein
MTENQSFNSEKMDEELDLDALNESAISAGAKGADIRKVGELMKELDTNLGKLSGKGNSKIESYSNKLRGYLRDSIARCM